MIDQKFKVGGVDAERNFFFLVLGLGEARQCSNSDCICSFALIYCCLQKQHGAVPCGEVVDAPKINVNGSTVIASLC